METTFKKCIDQFHYTFKEHLDSKIDKDDCVKRLSQKTSIADVEDTVYNFRNEFKSSIAHMIEDNLKFHEYLRGKVDDNLITKSEFFKEIQDYVRHDDFKMLLEKVCKLEEDFVLQNYSNETIEEDDFADLLDDFKDQNETLIHNKQYKPTSKSKTTDNIFDMSQKPPIHPIKMPIPIIKNKAKSKLLGKRVKNQSSNKMNLEIIENTFEIHNSNISEKSNEDIISPLIKNINESKSNDCNL